MRVKTPTTTTMLFEIRGPDAHGTAAYWEEAINGITERAAASYALRYYLQEVGEWGDARGIDESAPTESQAAWATAHPAALFLDILRPGDDDASAIPPSTRGWTRSSSVREMRAADERAHAYHHNVHRAEQYRVLPAVEPLTEGVPCYRMPEACGVDMAPYGGICVSPRGHSAFHAHA